VLTEAQARRKLQVIGIWCWQVPAAAAALMVVPALRFLPAQELVDGPTLVIAVALVAAVVLIPTWIIGQGLRRCRKWARRVVVVASWVNLATGVLPMAITSTVTLAGRFSVSQVLLLAAAGLLGWLNGYVLYLLRPSVAGWVCEGTPKA